MIDKLILNFIHWYLDKNNNVIAYSKKSYSGAEYVIRKFTRDYYEETLGFNAHQNKVEDI